MNGFCREGDKMAQLFEINDIVEVLSNCQSYGERGIVVDYFTVEHLLNNPIVRVKLDSGKTRIYNESSLKKCDEIEREAKNMALTEEEVTSLMNELLKLPNPFSCPHGRPTVIKMSKYDIERKFARK